jgi:hypothetical protein
MPRPKCQPTMSITDMLPSVGMEGNWLMVFRCFFDGGNKDDSAVYDTASLAVMCGFPHQWDKFNLDWKKMRNRHKTDFLHTTDLFTGNEPYNGWGQQRCDDLGNDAVDVIERSIARRKDNPLGKSDGIVPIVITLNLKDFISADKAALKISTSANEVLFRQALAISMSIGQNKGCSYFQMFFDQNERFYGLLHDLKKSKKARRDTPSLDSITGISEVNMRYYQELQMADLFAWCSSRPIVRNSRKWHKRMAVIDKGHQHYDRQTLTETMSNAKEIWDSWKIPRRTPTT